MRSASRWLKALQTAMYAISGIATFLVILEETVWVATLVVLSDIASNLLAIMQCEDAVIRANTATLSVQCTSAWWSALDEGEQIKRSNAFKCVESVEGAIAAQAVGALQTQKSSDDKEKNEKGS